MCNGSADVVSLSDDNKAFLYVLDGAGAFYKRSIQLESAKVEVDDGTLRYVNLDSVWYAIQEVEVLHKTDKVDDKGQPIYEPLKDDAGNVITTNHVVVAKEPMNDFAVNPNPFGQNPFDAPEPDDESTEEDEFRGSFNQMMDYVAGEWKSS